MPAGKPSAEALMDKRTVTFFSLDTEVIRAHGFRFGEGALSTLSLQRPQWVKLSLTEVTAREVHAQRMEPVLKATQALESAFADVERLTKLNLHAAKGSVDRFNITDATDQRFSRELQAYVRTMQGEILKIDGPNLARDMFTRYFDEEPPFEKKKDKKSEFPDAASLLVLEQHGEKHDAYGILVSNDNGWSKYAETSKRLYCVKTLDEFTALFQSEGDAADKVLRKVAAALADPVSSLYSAVEAQLDHHIRNADWNVDEIFGVNVDRVEGWVSHAELRTFYIAETTPKLWFNESDHTFCVIELAAVVDAQLAVDVAFFKRDFYDRDELSVGSERYPVTQEVLVEFFLECRGDLVSEGVDEWEAKVETSYGWYGIDMGHVEFDPGPD